MAMVDCYNACSNLQNLYKLSNIMQLNDSTDYAVRLMLWLSQDNQQKTVPEASKELGVSYHHLTKIVGKLSKNFLITTQKGKQGGICLNQSLDNINLGDIVQIMEGPTKLVKCLDKPSYCTSYSRCTIKDAFATVSEKMDALWPWVRNAVRV